MLILLANHKEHLVIAKIVKVQELGSDEREREMDREGDREGEREGMRMEKEK